MPPPADPAPLTGDMKADYYSGALADHALGRWSGWWCDIFLLPDARVAIIHNESTWIRVETRTIPDLLADATDPLFADEQQAARESFYRRLRSMTTTT